MNDDSPMPHGIYKGVMLKEVPLEFLLDEWEAGNLSNELRHYVASKVPIMAYLLHN